MCGVPCLRAERGLESRRVVQDRSQVSPAEACTLPPLLAGFGRSPVSSARPQADPLRPPSPSPVHG